MLSLAKIRARATALQPSEKSIRATVFVLRCAAAGTFAFLAAQRAGLPHPVWASMSALIVSQEKLDDTKSSLIGRIAGSLIGVLVALVSDYLMAPLTSEIALPLAFGIAVCAAIARGRPTLRVCMWTCAIVLITSGPADPILTTGLYRGAEVLLGTLIGGLLHQLSFLLVNRLILPLMLR